MQRTPVTKYIVFTSGWEDEVAEIDKIYHIEQYQAVNTLLGVWCV